MVAYCENSFTADYEQPIVGRFVKYEKSNCLTIHTFSTPIVQNSVLASTTVTTRSPFVALFISSVGSDPSGAPGSLAELSGSCVKLITRVRVLAFRVRMYGTLGLSRFGCKKTGRQLTN